MELSEDIREARRERIREIREERAGLPTLADLPAPPPPVPEPLLIERPPTHRPHPWEIDRVRERELVVEETRARMR